RGLQSLRIDAMPETGPDLPLDGHVDRRQGVSGEMDGLIGDDLIGRAVDEKDRRLNLDFGGQMGCSREMPRESDDGRRCFRQTQAHLQRYHGSMTEPHERYRAKRELRLSGFIKNECGESRLRLANALLPLTLCSHFEVEPLPSPEELARQRLRCMWRNKSCVRQIGRPRLSEADEIVPIRAIAVEKNHKLLRRAAGSGREARAINLNCHRGFLRNSSELKPITRKG